MRISHKSKGFPFTVQAGGGKSRIKLYNTPSFLPGHHLLRLHKLSVLFTPLPIFGKLLRYFAP